MKILALLGVVESRPGRKFCFTVGVSSGVFGSDSNCHGNPRQIWAKYPLLSCMSRSWIFQSNVKMSCTLGLSETLWKLKRDRTDGMLSPHEPVHMVAQGLTVKVGLLGADIDNLREVCPGDTVYVSDLSCGLEVQVQIFTVSKQDQELMFLLIFSVFLCYDRDRHAGNVRVVKDWLVSQKRSSRHCVRVCARVIFYIFNNQERKMQVPAQSKLVARRFGNP